MECIDDKSEPESIESCEWFIKKPFDANDFIEVINVCLFTLIVVLFIYKFLYFFCLDCYDR